MIHGGWAFFLFLVAWTLGLFMGFRANDELYENRAINAGVAEYYLDENNDKQFRYLERCEE